MSYPIAGQPYVLSYSVRVGGILTDLPVGSTVDSATLKQAGVLKATIPGPAPRSSTGVYLFPATTMPVAGDYDVEVTRTVGGLTQLDPGGVLRVYSLDGDVGSGSGVSLAQAKKRLQIEAEDTEDDEELQFYVTAANDWIATVTGGSTATPVLMGTLELIAHLWESQRGPASNFDDGSGSFGLGLLGFSIPTRVRELIGPYLTVTAGAPIGSFPDPVCYPDRADCW